MLQITKLKEENQKQKIELEFQSQEKKHSSLREDEEEKNARDRVVNQRLIISQSENGIIVTRLSLTNQRAVF